MGICGVRLHAAVSSSSLWAWLREMWGHQDEAEVPHVWRLLRACLVQVRVNVEAWLLAVEGGMQQSLRKMLRSIVKGLPSQVCCAGC